MKQGIIAITSLLLGMASSSLAADIDNVVLGSKDDKPLRLNHAPELSSNLFDGARIGVSGSRGRIDLAGSELAALDGNERSSLSFEADGQAALEIRFFGAPRFFNTVEIETSAGDVKVDVLTPRGQWVPWEIESASRSDAGHAIKGVDVRAAGLRITPIDRGIVSIGEVTGGFQQDDPDHGNARDGGGRSILTEWVENYSSAVGRLPNPSEDAQGLRDALPSSWTKRSWGNSNAWEEDFKSSVYGGTNSYYMDANDLSYFAGHGSINSGSYYSSLTRSMLFSNLTSDDASCTAGDARRCWGNEDCEWMALAICQSMQQSSRWAWTMNGLHLVLGWRTNMLDSADFGGEFGDWMVKDGWFDSQRTVLHSWCLAGEETHDSGYTILVIGETTSMGSDYLWGQGSVAADPTGNGIVKRWYWHTQDRQQASPNMPLELAEEFDGTSAKVKIAPELLAVHAGRNSGTMPVWKIQSNRSNAESLAPTAGRVMDMAGRGSRFDMGPDTKGRDMIAVGEDLEVRRSIKTGAIRVEDLGFWSKTTDIAPSLLRREEVLSKSMDAFATVGVDGRDSGSSSVEYFMQETVELQEDGSERIIDDETFPLAVRVSREHKLGNHPAWGPGASTTVTFGEEGDLVSMKTPAYADAREAGSVRIMRLDNALHRIAESGSAGTINGLRAPFDAVQVDAVELGYWLDGNSTAADIRPVFKLTCTCSNGDESFAAELIVPASETMPFLDVKAEGDGRVDWNEPITLQARSKYLSNGSKVSWYDDSGACIGRGPQVEASWSSPSRDGVRIETVEARITDAHGRTTSSHLDIALGNAGDLDADGTVDVDDLLFMLETYGKDVAPWNGGDADGSGKVDTRDLMIVIEHWGEMD